MRYDNMNVHMPQIFKSEHNFIEMHKVAPPSVKCRKYNSRQMQFIHSLVCLFQCLNTDEPHCVI